MVNKQVFVTGNNFSGTSALTGVVHLLGIPMGPDNQRNEDEEFQAVGKSPEELERVLLKRMRTYDTFGAKVPHLVYRGFEDVLVDTCDNPKVLVILRDPCATAQHPHNYPGKSFDDVVVYYQDRVYDLVQWAAGHDDTLFVSYEKLCSHTAQEVERVAGFLGVEPTQEAIDFVQPQRGYRRVNGNS